MKTILKMGKLSGVKLEITGLKHQVRKHAFWTHRADTAYLKQQRCKTPGDITSIKNE